MPDQDALVRVLVFSYVDRLSEHGDRPMTWAELNFRWAAKDRSRGARWNDSGGAILYATPAIRVRLPWFEDDRAPVLRGSTQIPLTSSWLSGQQTEEVVWSVGLAYSF